MFNFVAISDLDQSSEVRNLILAEVVGKLERSVSTFSEVLRTLVIICPFGWKVEGFSYVYNIMTFALNCTKIMPPIMLKVKPFLT